jgi:NADH:ubiquinone oxidoreductase subunit 3 (subunit A)
VRDLKAFGIVEMGIFVFTLLLALVYVWRKGALEWGE